MRLTLERIEELRAYDGLPSKAEYQALLDSARALARLEEWLAPQSKLTTRWLGADAVNGGIEAGIHDNDVRGSSRVGHGPDLLTATEAALARARAASRGRSLTARPPRTA